MKVSEQAYGKSRVRLSQVIREANRHVFVQLTADVKLSGQFDAAYTAGDNRLVIPTDTMKNTIYVLARQHEIRSIEVFARIVASHFVEQFRHVDCARVAIRQQLWHRVQVKEALHPHAFTGGGSEQATCEVVATRSGTLTRSGIDGLQLLKTTESGFSDFLKDEYTTLPETDDRIFATTIAASWLGNALEADWNEVRRRIRRVFLDVFSDRFSPSVQRTLHEMATESLNAVQEIDEISIEMPNQHHLLANLDALGLDNPNFVFVPTAEPFGTIAATVTREGVDT